MSLGLQNKSNNRQERIARILLLYQSGKRQSGPKTLSICPLNLALNLCEGMKNILWSRVYANPR